MARAMILAAGLGTRLRPLTTELPKPLVPLGDRPFVAHLIERLARAGLTEVVLNTHHGASHFDNRIEGFGAKVHLVHEPEIRGTAGGIAGARARLGPPPILAWNGDILADPPVRALLDAAAGGGLVLCVAPRPRGEGTVGLDAAGAVVRLRGETFGVEASGGDYVGIAALGAEVLARLPHAGCLIGDTALPALRRGESLATVRLEGVWTDIGSIAEYHAANMAWLAHGAPGGSFVAQGARVEPGVDVRASVVGQGALVVGAGPVERCVVWPGARAVAPLHDAIVTTSGAVVPVA
jgi:mannose-1-phosphate guanylyltransferase